jgi:hypothetical protein
MEKKGVEGTVTKGSTKLEIEALNAPIGKDGRLDLGAV